MTRRIWLHIGTEKTGTTSIQRYANRRRAALGRAGLVYPKIGPHAELHTGLVGPLLREIPGHEPLGVWTFRSLEEEWGDLRAVLQQNPDRDVLLSAEQFSTRVRPAGIEWIVKWFEDAGELDAVRVVVRVRRQDDLLLSAYAFWVLHGDRRSVREFLVEHPAEQLLRYDHAMHLGLWADGFGWERLLVGVHDPRRMPSGVVPSFFELIGRPELGAFEGADVHANRAASLEAVEAIRILNGGRRSLTFLERKALTDSIALCGFTTSIDQLLGDEERRALLADYEDSNRRLASLARGPDAGPLFDDPPTVGPGLPEEEVRSLGLTALTTLAMEQHGSLREAERMFRELLAAHDLRGSVLERLAADERVPEEALEDATRDPADRLELTWPS